MEVILGFAGAAWICMGLGVFATAKSAIHEILGCLAVSFGVMFWAFASIIAQLRRIRGTQSAAVAPTGQPGHARVGPISERLAQPVPVSPRLNTGLATVAVFFVISALVGGYWYYGGAGQRAAAPASATVTSDNAQLDREIAESLRTKGVYVPK